MVPVSIISGFLGAGKTTAIIKLLRQVPPGEKWAVIINEFGKVSIDGQVIADAALPGDIYNIAGGCICCSAEGYFRKDLEQIVLTGGFDRILIEPSGLGGLEMITGIMRDNPALETSSIVCITDITSINNPRINRNMIYLDQIRRADAVFLSKTDLPASFQEISLLKKTFRDKFPSKMIFTGIDRDIYYFVKSYRRSSLLAGQNQPEGFNLVVDPLLSDSNYSQESHSFPAGAIFNTQAFSRFFRDHPHIIRAKGYIHLESGWHLFNHTVSGFDFAPCPEKESSLIVAISNNNNEVDVAAELESLIS